MKVFPKIFRLSQRNFSFFDSEFFVAREQSRRRVKSLDKCWMFLVVCGGFHQFIGKSDDPVDLKSDENFL